MKVEEIMTKDPACCTPDDNAGAAAEIMRRLDTGIVPVTEALTQPSRLVGVITDRDLCLGVLSNGRDWNSARIGELMSSKLIVCRPIESAEQALAHMRRARVRRLPVVNRNFEVVGMISLGDIIRHKAAKDAEMCRTMAVISAPGRMLGRAKAA